jgi:hypothetical protein
VIPRGASSTFGVLSLLTAAAYHIRIKPNKINKLLSAWAGEGWLEPAAGHHSGGSPLASGRLEALCFQAGVRLTVMMSFS